MIQKIVERLESSSDVRMRVLALKRAKSKAKRKKMKGKRKERKIYYMYLAYKQSFLAK